MTTKTASVRLEKELFDNIDEKCVTLDCSRNDFIKNAIESALNETNKESDDDKKPYFDSLGNRVYWNYDTKTWVCELNPKNVKLISD